jgi:hypothetical protein
MTYPLPPQRGQVDWQVQRRARAADPTTCSTT